MGRPLFSSSYQAPAVRVEPEQPKPSYERWNYWNAFDPDSDEFFENDDAVYEAFTDDAQLQREEGAGRTTVMVVEDGSSFSDESSSGRGSPMDDSESVSMGFDLRLRRQAPMTTNTSEVEDQGEHNEGARAGYADATSVPASEDRVYQAGDMVSQYANMFTMLSARPDASSSADASLASSYTPGSMYVDIPSPSRIPSPGIATPPRPSTPQNQMSPLFASPSPVPTVTPRLYSWTMRHPLVPFPEPLSPVPSGPLTNRSARMSVAHIVPGPAFHPVARIVG
ncbi:hypothetical protein A0H81_06344 [Grifola frondosa]|uniref:Uncharacterized protein n=1 Tax=Grifola frondosa TaxID=5627 RepID=A0A1C7M9P6_GRIFR|nr:hypothetical protein A0H81_06344 [Grifola frondosa]